jgi:hypothetical protein
MGDLRSAALTAASQSDATRTQLGAGRAGTIDKRAALAPVPAGIHR